MAVEEVDGELARDKGRYGRDLHVLRFFAQHLWQLRCDVCAAEMARRTLERGIL